MKKLKLLILSFVILSQNGFSQTVTGTITTTPCNYDGVYSVTTTGLALPITYTYYVGGSSTPYVHSNINSTTDQLTNIPMTNTGSISCQVTSGNQSAWTQDIYTPSFTFSVNSNQAICPAITGATTAIQTSGPSDPYTYTWTDNQTLNMYTGNNVSLPIGEYSGEILNQTSGCVLKIDTAAIINQTSNISVSISNTPANCTNGTATAIATGGTAPYVYQWNNSMTGSTITGLSQGQYIVNITDAQGCQPIYSPNTFVQQTQTITINTTITDATCAESDGSVIAFASGGTSPYTYTWDNGQTGNTATNITAPINMYVAVTDANGCSGIKNSLVNSSTPITVTFSTTSSQCTSPTGSATLSISGGTPPYTTVWNSSPIVNGISLSNVSAGTYSFEVTDAVGCVRTGIANIPAVSTINAFLSPSTVACPATTGAITSTVFGSNPPFTYLWTNSATADQINNVNLGSYSCEITDALGCSVTKSATLFSTSSINMGVTTVPVTCVFSSDGSATSTVNGGVPPYIYDYSNGATTANSSGLATGYHSLTVTDANNCSSSQNFYVGNANTSTSCYCTISGHVYLDANTNCSFDSGENGIENIMVHCSGYGYTFTDANGYYSFQVPTGTYTITEQLNQYYPLSSCQNTSKTVNVTAATGCNTVVDISYDMNIIHDLKIVTINSTLPPIPGNNYQQKIIVKNEGTVTESGVQFGYEHDGQLPFSNSTSTSLLQLNNVTAPYAYSIQTGFPTLNPGDADVMLMNYSTPTNIPLGTEVVFNDTVTDVVPIATAWLLDYSPWDNVNKYETTVIGSYDPNYKEVYPKGLGTEGFIPSSTTEFDYTIHFQNEGTYYAQNIDVTDQLDAELDWTTLRPGYSDYEYTTTVSETGLVTFTFENIQLPWKNAYGDALSSGLINYSIKRKANNPQGTKFTNTANIYFDYNSPITTNTTLNTLNDAIFASTEEITEDVTTLLSVDIYPVPTNGDVTIRINNASISEIATVTIIDLIGNVVVAESVSLGLGTTNVTQSLSHLTKGTYIARIQLENGMYVVKKIVLQ